MSLVERWLIHHVGVVNELAVERLYPIHLREVEGVVWCVFAGCLDECACTQGFAVCEVVMHQQTVEVLGGQGDEATVVVSVADAGIESETARRHGRVVNGPIVHHRGSAEVKVAVVEIRPQTPDSLRLEVAELICHDGRSAAGVPSAVAGARKRGFKERLRCDARGRGCGVAYCGRLVATERFLQRCVGGLEVLSALDHHVRNRVEIDWLIFVLDDASDVTNLQRVIAVYLALDGEIERVGDVGPEVWVEALGRRTLGDCCSPDRRVAAMLG